MTEKEAQQLRQENQRLKLVEEAARAYVRYPFNGQYRTELRALLGENMDE